MGKVISFLNMKGGVLKTTLCRELAYFLEGRQKKILVIDVDPQSNCTQSFFEKYGVETVDEKGKKKDGITSIQNMYDVKLLDIRRESVILKLTDFLSIIPGDLSTVFMERDPSSKNEQRLYTLIKNWELREEFDYIFIDCPPTYSTYTVSALLCSDFYIAPTQPDLYSILGLSLLNEVVNHFITDDQAALMADRDLKCLGIILTKVMEDKRTNDIITGLKTFAEEKGLYIFTQQVKYQNKLATSKLSTFFKDRRDASLLDTIENLADDFERRIKEFES
ncbi:ParA family protein [Bacillus atrophaeus]|uniref:ParA family protein n=1 Tax=Bacillus atrophaeus TaxID=1452 RepID=UPI002162FD59|nr:AAA family ATPase [Bacillus atrophaeus]